ncbi:glycosyltransferase family 4 protein [Sporichthya brevicatena]|uniref:Glycosyltransferase family 4 protein n=1 Tax=Sporichthya brevicatena TaxID=171442 RepID=A0ABP3SA68_9ACTN
MPRILVVTNDYPPRAGGIQSFVEALVRRLPPDEVVVYAPAWEGAAAYDAGEPYPVVRHPRALMLPIPTVARRAREIARRYGCDRVLFGAAAPLGLLAPGLREVGVRRSVGITHGHEAGWALVPGGRTAVRRVGAAVDVLTYLGDYTRTHISRVLRPADRAKLVRLHPGVDTDVFVPAAGRAERRAELGLGDRPVVVCVSRLVRRKGQDVLIAALPAIRARVPGATLLLVGSGPDDEHLRTLAARTGVTEHVVFTGGVPAADLPSYYAAGDVFAMPCRTRRRGLDVEGLGMVFLEASATGLPVVVGDSGGAPDAVLPGRTGHVVDGRSPAAVARTVGDLLADPAAAAALGAAGRAWAVEEWGWDLQARRLLELFED